MIPKRVQWSRWRKPVLVAVAVTAALGLGAAIMTVTGHGGASDRLTAAQTRQRASAFTGTLALPLVALSDRDAAMGTMALPPEAEASLKADLEAGRTTLAWLSLWDDQAEDGDSVQISASGFALDLELYNAPHRIGIPVAGQSPGLVITGLHDGGGGITLGIQTTDGVVLTPVLQTGQVLPIGLR